MLGPADIERHAEMLANRVRKAQRKLGAKFERDRIGAYRLYDWDIPEVRAVVDRYEAHLVVGEYERTQTEGTGWLAAMGAACGEALEIPASRVHLKRRRTRPAEGHRYGRLSRTDRRIEVREKDLRFLCNLDDFVDTGLFAHHRITRALVRAEAAGKRVLNLFSYTGTFTCAAAAGGAASSASVDLSRAHVEWASDNLALNGLAARKHELVAADALAFVRDAVRAGLRWDLVVLDPPGFSTKGGSGDFDVQRDHRAMIEGVLTLLEPGGTLWFATSRQRFDPRLDGLPVRELKDMTERTVPEDYRNRAIHRCWRMVK